MQPSYNAMSRLVATPAVSWIGSLWQLAQILAPLNCKVIYVLQACRHVGDQSALAACRCSRSCLPRWPTRSERLDCVLNLLLECL